MKSLRKQTVKGGVLELSWSSTNWTFGIWWGVIGRRRALGLDLGPIELTWKSTEVRRRLGMP